MPRSQVIRWGLETDGCKFPLTVWVKLWQASHPSHRGEANLSCHGRWQVQRCLFYVLAYWSYLVINLIRRQYSFKCFRLCRCIIPLVLLQTVARERVSFKDAFTRSRNQKMRWTSAGTLCATEGGWALKFLRDMVNKMHRCTLCGIDHGEAAASRCL